jgi:hypothetical protein
MSYKSKHTGAQVDEAVSKVLNGEVGGATPDWSALVGEAGYIENKPFNICFKKFHDYNPELISKETSDDNETTYIYRVYGNWYDYGVVKYQGMCKEGAYDWQYIISNSDSSSFSFRVEENWLDIRYDDYHTPELEELLIADNVINGNNPGKISSALIDDTVLKTTPQTLTTSDKKQARENISAQEKLVSGVNVATINGESILGRNDIRINETIDLSDIITSRPSSTTEPIIVEINGGSDYDYIYSLDFHKIFIKTVNEITLNRYKGDEILNEIHFSYAGRTFPTYDYDHVIVYYNAPNYLLVCEAFSDQSGVYNCIRNVKFTLNKIN